MYVDFAKVSAIKQKIESLTERIERLKSAAESATSVLQKAPGRSNQKDRIGDRIATLLCLEEQLVNEQIDLEVELIIAEDSISLMPYEHQEVVRLRLNGERFKDIAKKTNYTEEHCRRIISNMLHNVTTKCGNI